MTLRLMILAGLLLSPLAWAQSTLLITTDAPCALTVNGTSQGNLGVDEAKAVEVRPGQQLIVCRSGETRAEQRPEVQGGQQQIVDLKLKARIEAMASGITTRYTAPGDGTVVDSQTGLVWAQRDNGSEINWHVASSYCSRLGTAGGGWRLPTVDELASLYDPSGTLTTRCGHSTCGAPQQFQLSSYPFWSRERFSSDEARYFDFRNGNGYSTPVSIVILRALCVRHPS